MKDRSTGKVIDKKEVIKRHKKCVEEMFKRGFKHNMVDKLDETLPRNLQKKSGISKTVYAQKGSYKSVIAR